VLIKAHGVTRNATGLFSCFIPITIFEQVSIDTFSHSEYVIKIKIELSKAFSCTFDATAITSVRKIFTARWICP
jgi:hypothetical protein